LPPISPIELSKTSPALETFLHPESIPLSRQRIVSGATLYPPVPLAL
jgi:hypothetical protein